MKRRKAEVNSNPDLIWTSECLHVRKSQDQFSKQAYSSTPINISAVQRY